MSPFAIADTGLLVAYLNPRDTYHRWAVEQFGRFARFLTCEAVLTEASHLAGRPGPVAELVSAGVLTVAYSLMGDEGRIATLIAKYADVPMDFADACLVCMSEQHRHAELLTIDSDFRVYRRNGTEPIPAVLP